MRYEITAPDGRRFEVTAPDGASEADVMAYAQAQFKSAAPHKPVDPTDGMSTTEKVLAGVGKGMVDVGRGIGQRVGLVSEKDVAESRKRDEALMNTGAGAVGSGLGQFALAAPLLAVPGANTVAGAAVVGGLGGAAQPTVEGESALRNTATGAVIGAGSQWGLGKAAEHFGKRLTAIKEFAEAEMAKRAVKDTAVAEARAAGYKSIPSVSGGNLAGRVVEGLTGKEKAAQLASVKNQPVTDALVRKALTLPDDAPLTHETMRRVRAQAVQEGYDPVRALPVVETDQAFRAQIGKLTSRSDNAAKDFGALVESDVKPLVEGLRNVKAFSGDTAVDAVSIFREKSSDLYAAGNKTLGKAYREAAEAIEEQIERALPKDAGDVIKNYRAARTKIAQSFDVEKALREGEGSIDARVIGKLYSKAPERMSGELATIGKSAAAMPDVMAVPKAGWANPVTALDSGIGTIGSILGGNPLPLAYPAARAAGRYGLMTDFGQRKMATPSYGPGAMRTNGQILLEALQRRGAGGALGSIYAAEE